MMVIPKIIIIIIIIIIINKIAEMAVFYVTGNLK